MTAVRRRVKIYDPATTRLGPDGRTCIRTPLAGNVTRRDVERITYHETRGVMETAKGSDLPERFPSVAGGVFPLYHVLADSALALFAAKGRVVESSSVEPLRLSSLVPRLSPKWRSVLANHKHDVCPVRMTGLPAAGRGARCGD